MGSEVLNVNDVHGSEVGRTEGVSSIFSEEARAKFDSLELCYLTHVVFRVLHKTNLDANEPSSYAVQVLVSPGVLLPADGLPETADERTPPAEGARWPALLPSDMVI